MPNADDPKTATREGQDPPPTGLQHVSNCRRPGEPTTAVEERDDRHRGPQQGACSDGTRFPSSTTGEHTLPIAAAYVVDTGGIVRFAYANPNYMHD